jgi:NhaP-type Na+/H+ or K+/H+ antiporter
VLPIGGVLDLGWPVLFAALALIFVVRPLAVLVALLPSGLPARHRLFIAWFGIRGIGSVYYAGFAFATLTPADATPIFSVVAIAILLSVAAHGLTSSWLTRRLMAADQGTP